MAAPVQHGLHHLKLPVSDLDSLLAWYERVFGAQHLAQFDHLDNTGATEEAGPTNRKRRRSCSAISCLASHPAGTRAGSPDQPVSWPLPS